MKKELVKTEYLATIKVNIISSRGEQCGFITRDNIVLPDLDESRINCQNIIACRIIDYCKAEKIYYNEQGMSEKELVKNGYSIIKNIRRIKTKTVTLENEKIYGKIKN